MRGALFLSFFDVLEEMRDAQTAARVKGALPAALRERIERGGVTRIGWYPLSDFASLHAACDAVIGGGEAFAFEVGQVGLDRDLRGFLRFILSITSPELLTRYSDKILTTYLRGASGAVEERGRGHSTVRFEGLEEATPLVCAGWAGGIHRMLEHCGAKDVHVDWRLRGGEMTLESRWT